MNNWITKPSRLKTLILGLLAGVAYALLVMLFVQWKEESVSNSFIFILPIVMGAIPVLFSTKEQLKTYWIYLAMPWLIVLSFFLTAYLLELDGMICLIIIIGPFLLLGSLGAFIYRWVKLRTEGNQTPLYASLLLPLVIVLLEAVSPASDQFHTVQTIIDIQAPKEQVWTHVKNVKNIQHEEIARHFIHMIGIPKPLNGELDKEGIGGIRSITWEKGIRFREIITSWQEGEGFAYDIDVDPASIPPQTLDEHVMIGGRYFDVVKGSYRIDSLSNNQCRVTLSCTYRITTNLNFYGKWWADLILDDFNEMILEVIKNRSEQP